MRGVSRTEPRKPLPRWVDTAIIVALVAAALAIGGYAAAWLIFDAGPAAVVIGPLSPSAEAATRYRLVMHEQPLPTPNLAFSDASGRALSLETFRGRAIVLNVWATWCVPCRKEMPSLDRLQEKVGSRNVLVLALSVDQQGLPAVKAFYHELGLTALDIYLDPSFAAIDKLGLPGVPGTLLIDPQGREVGRKLGPAEWDSPEMLAVIEHLGTETTPSEGAGR